MQTKRYSLPEGKAYRPFGSAVTYTNKNLTDEIAAALIKENPSVQQVFIDSSAEPQIEGGQQDLGNTDLDSSKLTKKELHAKYTELTGNIADDKLNHAGLVALVTEQLNALKAL